MKSYTLTDSRNFACTVVPTAPALDGRWPTKLEPWVAFVVLANEEKLLSNSDKETMPV
jgi:hypothetical protein